VMSQIK